MLNFAASYAVFPFLSTAKSISKISKEYFERKVQILDNENRYLSGFLSIVTLPAI